MIRLGLTSILLLLVAGCQLDYVAPVFYRITYNPNGGEGTVPVDRKRYTKEDAAIILEPTGLTKEGRIFTAWNTEPDGTGVSYIPGAGATLNADLRLYALWAEPRQTRTFQAQRIIDAEWYELTGALLAESDHCLVFGDCSVGISVSIAEAVAEEYERNIFPVLTESFGTIADIDGNGKVILLLLDIIDGYTDSGSYIMGYFQPLNMVAQNRADMLYLDVNPGSPGSPEFFAALTHELQHLINYSQTTAQTGAAQDVWIDEGLATAAEYLYQGDPNHRVAYYNEDPHRSIVYGNNFFVWNGYWEDPAQAGEYYDPVANYATAYLFFQWLRIHSSPDIYRAIISSPYRDYRAVTNAAAHLIDPSLGDWETLLKTWILANVYNAPAGLFGYQGAIQTTLHYFNQTRGQRWNFAPGEGVLSVLSGNSFSPGPDSGRHIRYIGLSRSSGFVELSEHPPYTGDYVLTFNGNANCNNPREQGYLADRSPRSRVLSPLKKPSSSAYPIDIRFNPDGGKP